MSGLSSLLKDLVELVFEKWAWKHGLNPAASWWFDSLRYPNGFPEKSPNLRQVDPQAVATGGKPQTAARLPKLFSVQ